MACKQYNSTTHDDDDDDDVDNADTEKSPIHQYVRLSVRHSAVPSSLPLFLSVFVLSLGLVTNGTGVRTLCRRW